MGVWEKQEEFLRFIKGKSHFSELPFHMETLLYKVSSKEILYPAENVRNLGVMVSSDLNWSKQIGNMVKKARSTLSWVFSIFKTRDRKIGPY